MSDGMRTMQFGPAPRGALPSHQLISLATRIRQRIRYRGKHSFTSADTATAAATTAHAKEAADAIQVA